MGNTEPCGECGQATRRRNYCSSYCEQRAALRFCVEALESALAGVWNGYYSGRGVTAGYAQKVDREVKAALAQARETLNEEPQPKKSP